MILGHIQNSLKNKILFEIFLKIVRIIYLVTEIFSVTVMKKLMVNLLSKKTEPNSIELGFIVFTPLVRLLVRLIAEEPENLLK